MKLAWAMTTADRAPQQNYLAETLKALSAQQIDPIVFPTSPEADWMPAGVSRRQVPPVRLTRVENGARLMAHDFGEIDWLIHVEDDVQPCADVEGSIQRWLERHAGRARLAPLWSAEHYGRGPVAVHPIGRTFATVAIALRGADVGSVGRWARAHVSSWRDGELRLRGFDKMVGQWHRETYPAHQVLATVPSLFQHIGRESSLAQLPRSTTRWIKSPSFDGRRYA